MDKVNRLESKIDIFSFTKLQRQMALAFLRVTMLFYKLVLPTFFLNEILWGSSPQLILINKKQNIFTRELGGQIVKLLSLKTE